MGSIKQLWQTTLGKILLIGGPIVLAGCGCCALMTAIGAAQPHPAPTATLLVFPTEIQQDVVDGNTTEVATVESDIIEAASPTNAIETATATSTLTPTPTLTPTQEPSATSSPSQIPASPVPPTDIPTTSAASFTILELTSPVHVGQNAKLRIQTTAGATCSIRYFTPKGNESKADGLDAKTADANGVCGWTWKIGTGTDPGTGSLRVTINGTTQTLHFEIQL